MGRGICGLGKDPEHVRELVGGMWGGTLPCSANLSQGMVTHIGMAIDTLFCKEPEVTNWSKTKNALTRLGLNTKLQDSKR